MANYLQWNDAIAAHFFRPEMAGRPVYLSVDRDVVADIGQGFGEAVEGFVSAVKEGPQWATHSGLCQRALQALDDWRARNFTYPPYVGYLAVFVLAAGAEGEFAPHAYYPRLRSILSYPDGGVLPSFHRMLELWDDLEQWSVRDKNSELGLFEAAIAGNWIHVGLPIAQTLLTERERKELPKIFSDADLDPTALPSDSALAQLLRVYGKDHLRPRTIQLLATRSDQDLFDILIDTIANELADWDGQVAAENEVGASAQPRVFSSLRLCLAVDLTAASAHTSLRCRLNRDFPDHPLLLSSSDASIAAVCEEFLPGWSSPLLDIHTRTPLDARRLNWARGSVLNEERLGWRFRFSGSPVRVFAAAAAHGLPGLIETRRLQRKQPFYILFQDDSWEHLRVWAETDCQNFQEHIITEGLPQSWKLASCAGAERDGRVRARFPALSFSDRVRIRLLQGIRASAGNSFFAFAPPRAVIDDAEGNEQVRCGDVVLTQCGDGRTFALPRNLPTDSRISIEVLRGDQPLSRSHLYLIGSFDWQQHQRRVTFDEWGEPAASNPSVAICGPLIDSEPPDTSSFRLPVLFTPGVEPEDARRIFFIGRCPGQIAGWPHDPLPLDWDPIWAVPMSRSGRAIFCGPGIDRSSPLADTHGPREKVELWREILWQRRRRVAPPQHPQLSALWRQYQECARDAR